MVDLGKIHPKALIAIKPHREAAKGLYASLPDLANVDIAKCVRVAYPLSCLSTPTTVVFPL